jgi:hypothetical protein
MKKILAVILILTALTLNACGSGETDSAATPDSIPAEFAGKTNPLGAGAATAGAEIFTVSKVMATDLPAPRLIPLRKIFQSLRQLSVTTICFGAFPRGRKARPWWRGKVF